MVMNLLKSLNTWLQGQSGNEVSYEALEKILENTAQVSPDRVRAVRLFTEERSGPTSPVSTSNTTSGTP